MPEIETEAYSTNSGRRKRRNKTSDAGGKGPKKGAPSGRSSIGLAEVPHRRVSSGQIRTGVAGTVAGPAQIVGVSVVVVGAVQRRPVQRTVLQQDVDGVAAA